MGRRPLTDPMIGNMRQLSISIPEDEVFYIEGMSNRWGIPVSSLVRIAIRIVEPSLMELEKSLFGVGDMALQYVKSRSETNKNLPDATVIKPTFDKLTNNLTERVGKFAHQVALAKKKEVQRAELAKTLSPSQIAAHLVTAPDGGDPTDILNDPETNPALADVDVSAVTNKVTEPVSATTDTATKKDDTADLDLNDILGIN